MLIWEILRRFESTNDLEVKCKITITRIALGLDQGIITRSYLNNEIGFI